MTIHNIAGQAARVVLVALVMIVASVASAQNPTTPPVKPGEGKLDDYYDLNAVQSIHLDVAKEDMKRMLAALPERISVPASFRWRDISIPNVSIRFKGNSSSAPSQSHKRSFLIRFDEFDKDQRFLGLQRVSFDNAIQFGSVFSETVITEILRDLGIKTYRCNYSKIFLNGMYHGVYVNVERIDQSFIERNLPDPDGLLFKVDEGGPGANLQFIGDDPSQYKKAFEPQTKSAKKGHQQLVDFIKMINQSPDREIASNLEQKMELDDFLKVSAVLLLSGAFDQLTGWGPHNYYLYHDGKNDRWRYLPWDLDVGFSETAFGKINVLADWNAAWPAAGQNPNPLIDRIVADPLLLQRYRDYARMILNKYFEPDRLCAIIDARYAMLKDDLAADPFPHRRITNPEDRNYDDIVRSIKGFVRKRYASADQQLMNPGKRPDMVSPPHGPPPQLVEKVHRIQRGAEQMQRDGKNVRPIQKIMEKAGPLLGQGQLKEAEKLIDEALKLVGENSDASKEQ